MKRSDVKHLSCSIARSLAVIGDVWSLMILRDAFYGMTRFEAFLENSGASRAVVADRLKMLVSEDVLERRPYQENPPRFDYRLTPKGRDLQQLLMALMAWGDRWLQEDGEVPLEVVHRPCGHAIHPVPACPHCCTLLSEADVELRLSPSHAPRPAARATRNKKRAPRGARS
jgi:DNA-binding HxlR family transcriptional regulator